MADVPFGISGVAPGQFGRAASGARPSFGRRVYATPSGNVEADIAEPAREAELNAIIGPGAHRVLPVYRAWRATGPASGQSILTWLPPRRLARDWTAYLFPLPWLFYRKLYFYGAIITLLMTVMSLVMPGLLGDLVGAVIWAILMRSAKPIYIAHALKIVAKADKRGLAGDDRKEFLRKAGGQSVLGLILGIAATIGGLFLM